MELAIPSKEPWPIRWPSNQLSSTKRMIELWSVTEWSTKFCFAHGERTSKGCLGPYPQRPSAWRFEGLTPGNDVVAAPQAPGPVSASAVPVEVFTIGPIWWSYHPSESSYRMTTAVLLQAGCASRKL